MAMQRAAWRCQAAVRVRAQAALAYDLAAVKFRGRGAATNFDTSAFDAELAQLDEARSAPAQVTQAAGVIGHISAHSSWHHQLPVSTLALSWLQALCSCSRCALALPSPACSGGCSSEKRRLQALAERRARATQVTADEVVQMLRRQSKGFQQTSSMFRGVTKHQKGKWEGRIGQMVGKKYKRAPPPLVGRCPH